MVGLMKIVSILCAKSFVYTLILRLLKALKPLYALKTIEREEQERKIREWKKKRLIFH